MKIPLFQFSGHACVEIIQYNACEAQWLTPLVFSVRLIIPLFLKVLLGVLQPCHLLELLSWECSGGYLVKGS